MKGSREQSVWFRFQQVDCGAGAACALVGAPQYYDTYWWSSSPGGNGSWTGGPEHNAGPAGFYGTLLENRQWWGEELAAEVAIGAVESSSAHLHRQVRHVFKSIYGHSCAS
jgi:hypothetical protein